MTELRHLQMVILEIMKDIDELCQRNHIDYYLNGGSTIGAVRHQGFIPWDDDLDIMMTYDHYERFIQVCREQLDPDKYYIQEGLKDWPLNYSKIKLKGTYFEEIENNNGGKDNEYGIFIDVFKIDNTSDKRWQQRIQYAFAKYRVCYGHLLRTYKTASWQKKLFMVLSYPMKIGAIRRFVIRQSERYNGKDTEYIASFYESKRFKKCIFKRTTFGTPQYLPFEDMRLPVQADYDNYLTISFGDYMQLPPEKDRQLKHLLNIDFGKY